MENEYIDHVDIYMLDFAMCRLSDPTTHKKLVNSCGDDGPGITIIEPYVVNFQSSLMSQMGKSSNLITCIPSN